MTSIKNYHVASKKKKKSFLDGYIHAVKIVDLITYYHFLS